MPICGLDIVDYDLETAKSMLTSGRYLYVVFMGIGASGETMNVFNALSAHYINNRYPEYKSKLSTVLDKKKAEEFLTNTERTYTWLKSRMT